MFRISNDTQRAKTVTALEGLRKQKEKIEKTKGERAAELFWKSYQRMAREFQEQIAHYDRLRSGDQPIFQGGSLRDLGAYLIDARIALGMTQAELAKKLGVSQPMVYKYENNEYRGYSLEIIEKASEALGVKMDLTAWRKLGKAVYSPEKQEAAMLYFLNNINNAHLGRTKLMKLLYYSDFEFYEKEWRPITGDEYVAQQYGPVPQGADALLEKMELEGKIHSEKIQVGGYEQTKYYPKTNAVPQLLNTEEWLHLENVAKRFEHWTARQMSDQTHEEYPWQTTALGAVIDYRFALNLKSRKSD